MGMRIIFFIGAMLCYNIDPYMIYAKDNKMGY
jgi:hypothetical protein